MAKTQADGTIEARERVEALKVVVEMLEERVDWNKRA
jgi:hypothetical protein